MATRMPRLGDRVLYRDNVWGDCLALISAIAQPDDKPPVYSLFVIDAIQHGNRTGVLEGPAAGEFTLIEEDL